MPGRLGEVVPIQRAQQPVARSEPERILVALLFTDIVDSTRRVVELGDAAWCRLLDEHDELIATVVSRFDGRVVKSLGDGAFAAFVSPSAALRCAHELTRGAEGLGLTLRAAVHVGECERRGDDLAGLAVHIGARLGALAQPGEVLASETVVLLSAGSGLELVPIAAVELKGVPGRRQVYALAGEEGAAAEAVVSRSTTTPDRSRMDRPRRGVSLVPRWYLRRLRTRGRHPKTAAFAGRSSG